MAGLGGRVTTRRWDDLPVDHGTQFLTATSGCAVSTDTAKEDSPRRTAPSIRFDARGQHGVWILTGEDGREFRACSLAVTAPSLQGETLLAESAPAVVELLRGIAMSPCRAVVARFPCRDLAWRGVQANIPLISWIGHDTLKRPDLHEGKTIVVVHASPAFSRANYAAEENPIVAALLARASTISGDNLRSPEAVFLQRWRYAQPVARRKGGHAVSVGAPAPLVRSFSIGRASCVPLPLHPISGCSTV